MMGQAEATSFISQSHSLYLSVALLQLLMQEAPYILAGLWFQDETAWWYPHEAAVFCACKACLSLTSCVALDQ